MTRGHSEGGSGVGVSITGHGTGVTGLAAPPRLAPVTADTPLYIMITLHYISTLGKIMIILHYKVAPN